MHPLTLNLTLPTPQSTIYFGLDSLTQVAHGLSRRGALLVDAAIAQGHGAALQERLGYELIPITPHKTRENKQTIEDALFERKLGRDSAIIGMGGGTTTDLVGFVASTYMRGVPLILIPTTLLGMVDAAIGGKTGVDTPFGKNLVGSFYLPKAVFIDVKFLKTLPEQELKQGMGEVLKYGLIWDASIWEKGEKWREELEALIRASVACKMAFVGRDFGETGLRRILNFGHTVGHGLELLLDIPHGEAVALGCMAESYLSHRLGYLSKEDLEIILRLYRKLGHGFKRVESRKLLEAMTLDKKAKGGEPRFVLIDRIGHCVPFDGAYCSMVKRAVLEEMIEWMNDKR